MVILISNLFCVKEETNKETGSTKWIGKPVPISVLLSPNLRSEPIFLCKSDLRQLVSSFISAFEGLATRSKAQMKLRFFEVKAAIMIKLSSVWEQLNRRNKQRERVSDFEYDESFKDTAEEKEFLTQFIQMQKNQLIQLKEHLKRYCHTLPVFGLNSAKCDINLIKSYLLPILVNERQIEPTVIKKANQIVFFQVW